MVMAAPQSDISRSSTNLDRSLEILADGGQSGGRSDLKRNSNSVAASQSRNTRLNTLHIKRACHAEGRGFEPRRSRQSFQWLSPRSRGRICFCPGRPPSRSTAPCSHRSRQLRPDGADSNCDCVPHQGVAIASRRLRRCGLIHFRAKTHCCLTHSLACAFLCAALRDESSFPGANPLDFGANRRSRPAQNRRMGACS
jgi:hypothetical protein